MKLDYLEDLFVCLLRLFLLLNRIVLLFYILPIWNFKTGGCQFKRRAGLGWQVGALLSVPDKANMAQSIQFAEASVKRICDHMNEG